MAQIQVRRDTAANWTTANTTLAPGEIGFETDTGRLKIGRSSTNWTALTYTDGVTGFNDRTGNVSLTSTDVTSALTYTPIATPANATSNQVLTYNGTAWTSANAPVTGLTQDTANGLYIKSYESTTNTTISHAPTAVTGIGGLKFDALTGTRNIPNGTGGGTQGVWSLSPYGLELNVPLDNAGVTIYPQISVSYINGDLRIMHRKQRSSSGPWPNTGFLINDNTIRAYASAGTSVTVGSDSTWVHNYTHPGDVTTKYWADVSYSPLVHTHAIANVTGLQTALDGKLALSNFTYANLPDQPTAYSLPTANTTVLGGVKVDGTSVTISNGTISVSTAYAGLGANTFTGSQNLQDNELIRAKIRDYSETVSSPTISAGTLVLNLETSNIFTVSLNAAITTLTISNPPASGSGGSFTLILTADGTARAVTWPASIKWAGGTAPTLTSTSGKIDTFAFFTSDGGTTWQGFVGGQNF